MYFRDLIWRIPWIILQTIIQYLKWWELSNSGTNGKHLESFVFFLCGEIMLCVLSPKRISNFLKFFKVFFLIIFRNQCWHHVATRTAYNNSYSGANVATGDDRYLHITSKIYVSLRVLFISTPTSVRLCACFSKSALRLSACLTWKELLWLWRTNTISRRSGGTQRTKM